MKIIQIASEFPPNCGGIGYYVFYLSKFLMNAGHEVSVVCRGSTDNNYYYEQIPVHTVKSTLPPPFNIPFLKRRIERMLDKMTADIVHIHSTAMPAISTESTLVVTAHWCNSEGIKLFHKPIKDMDSLYRNILFPLYKHVESKLVKSCDKLTVVSKSLQNEFLENYSVNSEIIYNGVDPNLFSHNKMKKENAVLFTGKLSVGKGVTELLTLAELLSKSHPKVTLYLIGNGPLKNKLQKLIKKKQLLNIKLINYLSHSELIEYYNRSLIYILPSYYEGFPTTILEAMSCKLPVIATNISGIPEQIEDGINGYLTPVADADFLYDRVVDLLDSSKKRNLFGENNQRKVLEKFTWDKVAQKIESIYSELLKEKALSDEAN